MQIFPKDSAENVLYTFDFAAKLAANEALTGTPTFTVEDAFLDAASTDLTVGTPTVAETSVQALLSGGVAGVLYVVECTATTDGGQTLVVAGGISVH